MDEIKRAVMTLLGDHPTPALRRSMAAHLERLAVEQRAIADADAAQARRPFAERVHVTPIKGKRGREPGRFVRLERRTSGQGADRITLFVGRSLWYEMGSPRRLAVTRLGNQVRLETAEGGDGYSVIAPRNHMPHMTVDGARDVLGDLDDGRYSATVRGRSLTIGPALASPEKARGQLPDRPKKIGPREKEPLPNSNG